MFGRVENPEEIRVQKALHVCCEGCSTALQREDESCAHCAKPRPATGWQSIDAIADPWLGRRVYGRYLVQRRIGRGGSAQVYLATTQAPRRMVALKIVDLRDEPGNHSEGTTRRRFEQEIRALTSLNSPHVLELIDIVELSDHHVGLVTEYLNGQTLGQLVRCNGRLEVSRAVQLGRQIANVVSQVHEAGLAHRDLKPDNIMVEELHHDDEFIHLIDFGIAHVCGQTSNTTGFIGTPLYASPEQSRGDELDFRTDIYSFGAVLFHLLTGEPPFTGTNPYQLLTKHVRETAPLLSEVADDRDFPDELEWLVAEMLRKSPEQRPGSMKEIAERLHGIAWMIDARRGQTNPSTGEVRPLPGAAIVRGMRVIPFERSPRAKRAGEEVSAAASNEGQQRPRTTPLARQTVHGFPA